ncbi:hypothetical protein ACXO19_07960 [Lactobacillus delbrueckii subsp. bulgaricus]
MALPHEGVHLYIDPINGFMSLPSGGPTVFVDQDGRRFVNENAKKYNLLYRRMAMQSVKNAYEVFNQDIYDRITAGIPDADKVLAQAVETNEGDSLYKEDSLEDLANHFDLPKDILTKTLNDYNKFARQGKDEEFAKDSDNLIPMNHAVPQRLHHHHLGWFGLRSQCQLRPSRGHECQGLHRQPKIKYILLF